MIQLNTGNSIFGRIFDKAMADDISAGKHKGNEQSVRAHRYNHNLEADRNEVLRLIAECPRTMKEIAAVMGKEFNAVSGRGSELKRLGLVRKTGEVRDGSAVLEVIQ